jgi:hypothetical protein
MWLRWLHLPKYGVVSTKTALIRQHFLYLFPLRLQADSACYDSSYADLVSKSNLKSFASHFLKFVV